MNKDTIDRSKPPVSAEIPRFKFPGYKKIDISEKLTVYTYEDYTQPLITMKAFFHKGAAEEKIPGLASFTAELMMRGTKNRTASGIAEETDMIGAGMRSIGNWEDTSIGITALADHCDKAFELLTDCLLNPLFSENETERLRKKFIADIKEETSEPGYLAKLALNSLFYQGHPYSHPRDGTIESISSLTRDDCINWHNSMKERSKITVIIAGNGDFDSLVSKFRKELSTLPLSISTEYKHDVFKYPKENRVVIINKADAKQTSLRIAKPSISRENDLYPALVLANTVYGGYFMSRLNNLLREIKGYTYGVHSNISARKNGPVMSIGTDVNEESTADAVLDILSEMELISKNPVKEEEFNTAMQYLLGAFSRKIETPQQIAMMIQGADIYGLPANYFDDFFNDISKLTPEKVFEAQKKYLKPESLVIAAAGDAARLRDALKEFGEIHLCDTEGNIT